MTATPPLLYRSNHRRAQIAVIGLAVCALISAMTIVNSVITIEFFRRLDEGNFTMAELTTADERLRTLGLFELGSYIVTSILFLLWIYRAYQNHEQFARRSVKYSPNWAAFGFLVPFINLVRPYQVMAEMRDETQLGDQNDTSGAAPSHAVVIVWWLAFLAMNYVSRLYSSVAARADTGAGLTSAAVIDMAVQAAIIVSAVLAIRIIQTIDVYHHVRWQQTQPMDVMADQAGWSPIVYAWALGLSVIIAGIVLFGHGAVVGAIDQTISRVPAAQSEPRPAAPTTKRAASTPQAADLAERGQQELDAGNFDQALDHFTQALKLEPKNAELYYLRAITYTWLDDYDKALADFDRAIQLDPKMAEVFYERGIAHLYLENYDLAEKDFDQAVGLDVEYIDAYVGRAWLYYLTDEYDAARKDIAQALRLDQEVADIYHVRGLILLDTGEFDQAIADFSKAIELEPDSAAAFNRRGLAYHARGDLAKALEDFEQALKLEPDFIDATYNRGLVNYDRGAYQSAIADFTTVIKQYPDFGLAYLQRGAAYGEIKDYAKAIADVEQALQLELSASDRTDAKKLLEDLKAARTGQSS